eukprot:g2670.t1
MALDSLEAQLDEARLQLSAACEASAAQGGQDDSNVLAIKVTKLVEAYETGTGASSAHGSDELRAAYVLTAQAEHALLTAPAAPATAGAARRRLEKALASAPAYPDALWWLSRLELGERAAAADGDEPALELRVGAARLACSAESARSAVQRLRPLAEPAALALGGAALSAHRAWLCASALAALAQLLLLLTRGGDALAMATRCYEQVLRLHGLRVLMEGGADVDADADAGADGAAARGLAPPARAVALQALAALPALHARRGRTALALRSYRRCLRLHGAAATVPGTGAPRDVGGGGPLSSLFDASTRRSLLLGHGMLLGDACRGADPTESVARRREALTVLALAAAEQPARGGGAGEAGAGAEAAVAGGGGAIDGAIDDGRAVTGAAVSQLCLALQEAGHGALALQLLERSLVAEHGAGSAQLWWQAALALLARAQPVLARSALLHCHRLVVRESAAAGASGQRDVDDDDDDDNDDEEGGGEDEEEDEEDDDEEEEEEEDEEDEDDDDEEDDDKDEEATALLPPYAPALLAAKIEMQLPRPAQAAPAAAQRDPAVLLARRALSMVPRPLGAAPIAAARCLATRGRARALAARRVPLGALRDAQLRRAAGDFSRARSLALPLIASGGTSGAVLELGALEHNLALVHAMLGDVAAGYEVYRASLAAGRGGGQAGSALGPAVCTLGALLLGAARHTDFALQLCEVALAEHPDDFGLLLTCARVQGAGTEDAGAEQRQRQGGGADASAAAATLERIEALMAAGRYGPPTAGCSADLLGGGAAANADADTLSVSAGDIVEFWCCRAEACVAAGDMHSATTKLQLAREEALCSASPVLNADVACTAQGLGEDASVALMRALELERFAPPRSWNVVPFL